MGMDLSGSLHGKNADWGQCIQAVQGYMMVPAGMGYQGAGNDVESDKAFPPHLVHLQCRAEEDAVFACIAMD